MYKRQFQNTVLLIVLVTLVTFALALVFAGIPVSYTHLDVYKRQAPALANASAFARG